MFATKPKRKSNVLLTSIIAIAIVGLASIANADYTDLYNFGGGAGEGETPYGSLVRSGNILYGMTESGGISNKGVIFKIDSDGNNYTTLHNFTGIATDGSAPHGSLTISGNTLFGMTAMGGANNVGVIFLDQEQL